MSIAMRYKENIQTSATVRANWEKLEINCIGHQLGNISVL